MKLFSTYSRINLLATVLIFVLASVAYYFLLRFVIIDQLDENLQIEKEEIETYVQKYQKLPEVLPVKDQIIRFERSYTYQKQQFSTQAGYDLPGTDTTDFRKLTFYVRPVGSPWSV